MDDKDRSIATQVAFKGAIDNAVALSVNLGSPEGQGWFEETFSYLSESLLQAITTGNAADAVIKAFPGSEVVGQTPNGAMARIGQPVPQQPQPVFAGSVAPMQDPYQQAQTFQAMPTPAVLPQTPQQQGYPGQQSFQPNIKIKGQQYGPLPDWLYSQAAEKGVTELYDNRDRAMGTKRPWFKATTGGDNAAAFWPPRD